jgi:NTP pyrophosphatase (non-canonical NTP hydrolase)
MDLNEYQLEAKKTKLYPDKILYPMLGLVCEAGEVAQKVKRVILCHDEIDNDTRAEIADELGDVLWYVANIADDIGYNLEVIALNNLSKVTKRKAEGKIIGWGDKR